jgi:hypothetical protein
MGLRQYVRDRAEPCLLWSSAVAIRLASLQACRTQLKSTSSTRSFRDRVRFHQRGSITTAPLTQLCLLPFRLYRSTFHTEDLQLQLNQAHLPLLECSFMIFFYFKTARPLEFAHRLAPCLCHATTDRKVKRLLSITGHIEFNKNLLCSAIPMILSSLTVDLSPTTSLQHELQNVPPAVMLAKPSLKGALKVHLGKESVTGHAVIRALLGVLQCHAAPS